MIRAGHIAALAAALTGMSCISPHQSAAVDVDPAGWHEAVYILLPNADTVSLREINLFLSHNDRFREDTLSVEVSFTTPDGLVHSEPFRMVLSRSGETAAALLRESAVTYRRNVRFPQTGDYRLMLTPLREVRGVKAVGINITKSH